jgi:hypothetical protein
MTGVYIVPVRITATDREVITHYEIRNVVSQQPDPRPAIVYVNAGVDRAALKGILTKDDLDEKTFPVSMDQYDACFNGNADNKFKKAFQSLDSSMQSTLKKGYTNIGSEPLMYYTNQDTKVSVGYVKKATTPSLSKADFYTVEGYFFVIAPNTF